MIVGRIAPRKPFSYYTNVNPGSVATREQSDTIGSRSDVPGLHERAWAHVMTRVIELPAGEVNFDQTAADQWKWRSVALSLLFAADTLWKRVRRGLVEFDEIPRLADLSDAADVDLRLRGPFFLLAGLAVENLLKALIVKRMQAENRPVTEGNVLKLERGRHNLLALSGRAQITLSSEEREVLARLSTFVRWAGRYPVPIRKTETTQSRITRSDDFARIKLFLGRLQKEFNT